MTICGAFWRKKQVDEASMHNSKLARVLNTFDLTALGVGSTLGVGIYVIAGEVSKTTAGPAVVLSFLLAAITSVFAGLCFAEFGARVPKAGSAYVYSYYCVGELVAFVIGWNLILEYVIGAASVARGISTYIDSLVDGKISESFTSVAPMNVDFLSPFVDFFAFGLCVLLAVALAFGVKESTIINNVFTTCNVAVVLFVIISGIFKSDAKNWNIKESEIPEGTDGGTGGFAPFGIVGIIKGAAICFYGFVGFDCIATTGEEVKNPQKAIPIAILVSLFLVFLAYSGVSIVLTLMWPYYLQDPTAPLPYVYEMIGWTGARWVVGLGALFGLFASLFGAMFPLPRIIYSMANDGLIFQFLGKVHPKYQTPLVGTLFAGFVTAIMAAFFDLQQLISMMALGTLIAYTIVAICVLVLRYMPDEREDEINDAEESTSLVNRRARVTIREYWTGVFNWRWSNTPSALSARVVTIDIFLFVMFSVGLALVFTFLDDEIADGEAGAIVGVAILAGGLGIITASITSQPKSSKSLPFKMPLVPLLPCLSIFINIYLMVVLDGHTWIRFAVWMGVGIIPYAISYCWKYKQGLTGQDSLYTIHRLNAVKLNESIWNIIESKQSFYNAYENTAYAEEQPENPDIRIIIQEATPMPSGRESVSSDVGLQMAIDTRPPEESSLRYAEEKIAEPIEFNRLSELSDQVIVTPPKKDDNNNISMDKIVNESYGFLSEEESDKEVEINLKEKEGRKEAGKTDEKLIKTSDETDSHPKPSDIRQQYLKKIETETPKQIRLEEKDIQRIIEPKVEAIEERIREVKSEMQSKDSRLSQMYLEKINKSSGEEPEREEPKRGSKIADKYIQSIKEEPSKPIPKPPPLPSGFAIYFLYGVPNSIENWSESASANGSQNLLHHVEEYQPGSAGTKGYGILSQKSESDKLGSVVFRTDKQESLSTVRPLVVSQSFSKSPAE